MVIYYQVYILTIFMLIAYSYFFNGVSLLEEIKTVNNIYTCHYLLSQNAVYCILSSFYIYIKTTSHSI